MAGFGGWQRGVLQALGAPATSSNLRFLNAWQQAEGGGASFNPLNTTQHAPGASSYNSVGVRNFVSPQQGIQATARTLMNGFYNPIVQGLRSGQASATQLAQEVARSPWGTGAGVLRVLGSGGGAAPPAQPAAYTPPRAAGVPLRARGPRTDSGELAALQGLAGIIGLPQSLIANLPPLPSTPQLPGLPVRKLQVQYTKGAAPSARASNVVNLAHEYLGTPYVWGGERPGGFDCSGFVQYLYGQQGIGLPRTTYDQWKVGAPIRRSQLQAGDAVFFRPGPSGPEHEGLYIGGGKFIQAPHTGDVVKISNINSAYYRQNYMGARRFGA